MGLCLCICNGAHSYTILSASSKGGSVNLRALMDYWPALRKLGLTPFLARRVLANKAGSKNAAVLLETAEQLMCMGFSAEELARMTSYHGSKTLSTCICVYICVYIYVGVFVYLLIYTYVAFISN